MSPVWKTEASEAQIGGRSFDVRGIAGASTTPGFYRMYELAFTVNPLRSVAVSFWPGHLGRPRTEQIGHRG
jgi:hypothetical protein